jgi:hypothetical protein
VAFSAVIVSANIFDSSPGAMFVSLANAAWGFYAATLGVRDVMPSLTISRYAYLRFFGATFWNVVLVIVPPAIFLALVLPESMDSSGAVKKVGPLIAAGLVALVYIAWAGSKWSLSTVIALMEGRRVFASLRESWAITRNAFWPTLLLTASIFVATIVTLILGYLLFAVAVGFVAGITKNEAQADGFVTKYGPAMLVPAEMYLGLATWIAYARYLVLLRSREVPMTATADLATVGG